MAQFEPGISKSPQQKPLPARQQSPDLNLSSLHHVPVAGKEATIHDFLSLGGSKSMTSFSTVAVAPNGLQSNKASQDLMLQGQQKGAFSGSPKAHINSIDHFNVATQDLVNGGVDVQANRRQSDFGYGAKTQGHHSLLNHRGYPQHQKKKLTWVVSEDDDEDDDSPDNGYNSKRETSYQNLDVAQKLEEKFTDVKGLTPRSKHSATEQRRRSKINDRFQMLRQLLPHSDQKRDKASFLYEVIEHIQMLHEKVKKYESAEHLGQLQERPKACPWDRISGLKEGVIDASCRPSFAYDSKDAVDVNCHMVYESSPLRMVGQGNGTAHLELIPHKGHTSAFPHRFLQESPCQSSYESVISKPTLLTFTTPPIISTEDPATPTLFPSGAHSMSDTRTMFVQLLHQEEQAAMRSKRFHNNEVIASSTHLCQTGKSMPSQTSTFPSDPHCEKQSSPELCTLPLIDNRTNEEMGDKLRSSPVSDIHRRSTGTTLRECRGHEHGTSRGLDSSKPVDVNIQRQKAHYRGEVLTHDRGHAAVLGGKVNISSPYSQGLLDSLTRALQSSGVDLAQASISVQIDLGQPNGSGITSTKEIASVPPPLQRKEVGVLQESEHAAKRLKVEIDS